MHWAKSLDHNLGWTLHYINSAAEAGSQVILFPRRIWRATISPSCLNWIRPLFLRLWRRHAPLLVRKASGSLPGQSRRRTIVASTWPMSSIQRRHCPRVCEGEYVRAGWTEVLPRGRQALPLRDWGVLRTLV